MARREAVGRVRGMAIICFASAALLTFTAIFPVRDDLDLARRIVAIALTFGAGALYWVLAPHFRVWTLHAVVAIGFAWGALGLASAPTPVAAALTITTLLWTSVYVGVIFEPFATRVYAALVWVGLGAALLVSQVPSWAALWVAFGTSFVVVMELLTRMSSRLRADAATDPLTGLPNRKGFREAAERALAECGRSGEPLTLVHIDLDDFKEINDRAGHLAGDRLLRELSDAWRSRIGPSDVLARIGGDEFVLVLPGTTRAGAVELMEHLRAETRVPWSYGVAERAPGDDLHACLARADAELYAAKAERKRRAGGLASVTPLRRGRA